MKIKPLWQCRKFEHWYQISAIVRDGENVYRACECISFGQIDHAWHPEFLVLHAIQVTQNSLYEMIESTK